MLRLRGALAIVAFVGGFADVARSQVDDPPSPTIEAGFTDLPQFGGPQSVPAQLEEDDAVKEPWFRFSTIRDGLAPWFRWKEGLHANHGLSVGLDYTALYQKATDSLGEDDGSSGIFRVFGQWVAVGRGTQNTGSLVYKVENRHGYWTDLTPFELGFAVGSALPTALPFSDAGWGLTNLYWQQKLNDGKVSLLAGQVDPTDYVDVYGLVNPWTAFSNFAFSTNPTIAVPNQGLGAVAGYFVTDSLYAVGGLADANGDPTEPFETIDEGEFFVHAELGWTPSFDRRYFDNAHVTAWHVDEREAAGAPDGWGVTGSYTRFLDDKWVPFVRAGWSDGQASLVNGHLATGLGIYRENHDLFGFGVAWSEPSAGGARDQYTSELFYRFQLSQNTAITPGFQLIVDPSQNPAEDVIGVFGLRVRISL